MAKRFNTRLDVLFADDPLLVAAAGVALHDTAMVQRRREELARFVRRTLPAAARAHLRLEVHACVGRPAEAILRYASGHRVDLIVMGTHGVKGIDRLLIGSTTMGVLQRARIPVLAVSRAQLR